MVEKVQVNVLLPDKLAQQIRVVAEIDGEKLSVAAEKAIKHYVAMRKQDADWQARHEEWARKQRALLRAI